MRAASLRARVPDFPSQINYAGYIGPSATRRCASVGRVKTTDDSAWAAYARRLGVRLNQARHTAGLSQERLAYAAGLTRSHYQQLEKGESAPGTPANPRLRTLIALAQALGLRLEELLPLDGLPDLTDGR